MNMPPPALFIFLGASNMARGHGGLIRFLSRALQPRPARFLMSLGPGRGYCSRGGILYVRYPPIGASGVFAAAEALAAETEHVRALVTDIGNDIMYGVPVDMLIECLEGIFARLAALNAKTIVTPIPSFLEAELGPAAFLCLRTLLYPRSGITWENARAAIRRVNSYLRSRVDGRLALLGGLEDCFGWDRVHYSWFAQHHALTRIAQSLLNGVGGYERKMKPGDTAAAYAHYWRDLIVTDFLPLRQKGAEHY